MSLLCATCEIDFSSSVDVPVILMLRPRSGVAQWVFREEYSVEPRLAVIEHTDMFGNLCQRAVIRSGETRLRAACTVDVASSVDVDVGAGFVSPGDLPEFALPFLLPSRYCPSDQLNLLAQEIIAGLVPGYKQVEAIREWLYRTIEYRYGHSTQATTAADTARDRIGVCRDFAHLGISLCRALNIPARMVVGYIEKTRVPDVHAWFEAYLGGRWFTFDGTHERTLGNRIAIAYGRDATDVAFVTHFGPLTLTRLEVTVTAQ